MAQPNSPDVLPRHVKKVPLGLITDQYLLHVWHIGSTLLAVTNAKLFTFFMSKVITNCKDRNISTTFFSKSEKLVC